MFTFPRIYKKKLLHHPNVMSFRVVCFFFVYFLFAQKDGWYMNGIHHHYGNTSLLITRFINKVAILKTFNFSGGKKKITLCKWLIMQQLSNFRTEFADQWPGRTMRNIKGRGSPHHHHRRHWLSWLPNTTKYSLITRSWMQEQETHTRINLSYMYNGKQS